MNVLHVPFRMLRRLGEEADDTLKTSLKRTLGQPAHRLPKVSAGNSLTVVRQPSLTICRGVNSHSTHPHRP